MKIQSATIPESVVAISKLNYYFAWRADSHSWRILRQYLNVFVISVLFCVWGPGQLQLWWGDGCDGCDGLLLTAWRDAIYHTVSLPGWAGLWPHFFTIAAAAVVVVVVIGGGGGGGSDSGGGGGCGVVFVAAVAADDVAALFSSFVWVFSDFLFFNWTEIEIFLLLFFLRATH